MIIIQFVNELSAFFQISFQIPKKVAFTEFALLSMAASFTSPMIGDLPAASQGGLLAQSCRKKLAVSIFVGSVIPAAVKGLIEPAFKQRHSQLGASGAEITLC